MKKLILLSSAAAIVAFAPVGAFAQETANAGPAEASMERDTIIVTARRRSEAVDKVPIAITAFSGEQLVAKGVRNLEDLTKLTPGLNISAAGAKNNAFIVIRGQSKGIVGNSTPGVIVYQNDVPLSQYGSLIQSYDMENIQVLKGPQGTLFGRNAIGGAILAVSKAPTYDFGGYVSAQVEQHDNYQGEGAINIPIVKDRIALRVAAQVGRENNNVKTYRFGPYTVNPLDPLNPTPGQLVPNTRDWGEISKQSYRVSLLVEPTDWITNVTVGDYTKIRGLPANVFAFDTGVGAYTFPPAAFGAFASVIGNLAQCTDGSGNPGPVNCNFMTANQAAANAGRDRVTFMTQDAYGSRAIMKGVSNTTTISLGDDHQIKNIFAYRETDAFTLSSLNGIAIPVITTSARNAPRQITEELQFSGSFFDHDLQYTIGGFLLDEKPNKLGGSYFQEINAFFGLSHSLTATYLANKSKAIYGQVDYSLDKLIPGLSVTAGLRHTWDKQTACATALKVSPFAAAELINSPADLSTYVGPEGNCRSGAGLPTDGFGSPTTSQIFPDAKFNKLTYTLGANWEVSSDAMVYATHRRGYRAGGINTPLFDPYLAASQNWKPETLTDWEVGAKLRLRSGDVRGALNLALFTGKDVDNQLPLNTSNLGAGICVPAALGTTGHPVSDCTTANPGADGLTGAGSLVTLLASTPTVTGGSLTIRGVEVDGMLSPMPGLTFTGGLSYTDVRVDKTALNERLTDFLVRAGLADANNLNALVKIQAQPTWIYNAGILVEAPGKVLGGDFSVSLDYHYTGSYQIVQLKVPSYKQVDLRVNLADIGETGLSASAWVRNLTDEVIYTGASSSSRLLGAQSYGLGPDRTFGLSLSYRFGD